MLRMCPLIVMAGLIVNCGSLRADRNPSEDPKFKEPVDARALLEKGRACGALPEGMVVRVAACLGAADVKASGDQDPDGLRERWEFTSNEVHRTEYKEGVDDYCRVESHPFDTKVICQDLLDGNALEIQARKGKGPKVAFAGTIYRKGTRSIEVVWRGENILDLLETNGAGLVLYRETDACAFGALYERLAARARDLFKSKAGPAK